jgi:hypothetical protein
MGDQVDDKRRKALEERRTVLAAEILARALKIKPTEQEIEDRKSELRDIAIELGEGFTEDVTGKGSVEVKAGTKEKFKGIVPELDADAFYDDDKCTPARRAKLIEDGIVAEVKTYTKATKPSVTVRPV